MIDYNNLLDQFPQVSNRGVIKLVPTKLYVDWYNYVSPSSSKCSATNIEPILILVDDFDTRKEFDEWLACNFPLLFEIRLNYACTDKTKCP
jgi:hypothetical protein